ncbi:MAG: hypothetical protein HON90_10375 [Halobacteriovoraceae bacterium]|jgi:hypothetical protein|nr:hypothetical protein [Halobacteriovoraceae bacterium]
MIAVGLLGGLSLALMQVMKNVNDGQSRTAFISDEAELSISINMILDNANYCKMSLSGMTFEKKDIDFGGDKVEKSSSYTKISEGLNVELWYSNIAGDTKTTKMFNGADNIVGDDRSQFGKLKIKSMKLVMFNGPTGCLLDNYCLGDANESGQIVVLYDKKINSSQTRPTIKTFPLNLGFTTDGFGVTTIKSCSRVPEVRNQLQCYTLRRYEKIDYRNFFLDSNGNGTSTQNGLNYNDVVTLYGGCCPGGSSTDIANTGLDNDPLSTGVGNPNVWYGIKCNSSNGFFMLSCGHASSEDASDNDFVMTNDGCFSGDNDGVRNRNILDIRCCRYE